MIFIHNSFKFKVNNFVFVLILKLIAFTLFYAFSLKNTSCKSILSFILPWYYFVSGNDHLCCINAKKVISEGIPFWYLVTRLFILYESIGMPNLLILTFCFCNYL